jgi:hypothetical protein
MTKKDANKDVRRKHSDDLDDEEDAVNMSATSSQIQLPAQPKPKGHAPPNSM